MSAVSRRRFLQATGALCGGAVAAPLLGTRLAFASPATGAGTGTAPPTLVLICLRGGLDGLSAVVPVGDAAYYDSRKALAIPAAACTALDGRFGLHPALAPLAPFYGSGELAFVQGVGSVEPSRSHFVQQGVVDHGSSGSEAGSSGWLGRHLAARPSDLRGIRAAALTSPMPAALAGDPQALAAPKLDELLASSAAERAAYLAALRALNAGSPLEATAGAALDQVGLLDRVDPALVPVSNGAAYEDHPWSDQLRAIAQLVRSGVGLEAAVVETGGWDLHIAMGLFSQGQMREQLSHLANALAAFATDLYDILDRVTVVVLSEFGRRVAANGSGGTDHGRGGLMMVLGRGIAGGRVYGDWLGLAPGELDDGDVPVTTDFRDVVGELLVHRAGAPALDVVFPGYQPRFLGLAG